MSAEQQVNLTDLEPIQLQEVKKQLDSVRLPFDMIYDHVVTCRDIARRLLGWAIGACTRDI
jgi:hypothetical protein